MRSRDPRRRGWTGVAVAIGVALVAAALAAWLTPRGPITAADALGSVVVALVVGGLAGFATGSRWSIVVTPLIFMAAFEVVRLPISGPTVDGIELGSTYGLIAFATGRVLHGLFVLLPMALGALHGVMLAHRAGRPPGRTVGLPTRVLAGLLSLGLVGLGTAVAAPSTTAPILGPDGAPVPGSIAELTTVRVGGHDQALMIRGRSTTNPVLLHLAGGPGGTDLGAMRADTAIEQDFVVVTWEQRGSGKSYAALDPTSTLTVDGMVRDTIELVDHLRARFNENRVFLTGNSWGALLGVLAVQRAPDRFHAFVGTGQMVSPTETDRMFWEDTLAWATATGDEALARTLRENGPPPYDDLLMYEPAIAHEHEWNPYPELDLAREMPANLFVPENSLLDRVNGLRSFLDTFAVLYPQLRDVDLRATATRLDIPVVVVTGAYEARGRAIPARAWFEALSAPSKTWVVFEHSGHRPSFEEPAAFADLMDRVARETLGPLAAGGVP